MTSTSPSSELNTLLDTARKFHAGGQTLEAIQALESSERYASSPRVRALIAHFYYLLEQYDTAAATAHRALESDPKNRFSFHTLGEVAMKRGCYEEAEGWFREAIAAGSRTPHPFLRTAAACLARRKYADAIDILYKGLEIFSGHPKLLDRLQYALTMDGRINEAAQIRKTRLRENSPDSADLQTLVNRFEALDKDRAITQLQLLVSMEHYRGEAILHDQLSRYLMERERFAEAIPHLETVGNHQPRNIRSRLNLALCLFKTGDSERAWNMIASMETYRKDAFFSYVRMEGLIADNRIQEALAACIEQLKACPRDRRFRKLLQKLKRKGATLPGTTETG